MLLFSDYCIQLSIFISLQLSYVMDNLGSQGMQNTHLIPTIITVTKLLESEENQVSSFWNSLHFCKRKIKCKMIMFVALTLLLLKSAASLLKFHLVGTPLQKKAHLNL